MLAHPPSSSSSARSSLPPPRHDDDDDGGQGAADDDNDDDGHSKKGVPPGSSSSSSSARAAASRHDHRRRSSSHRRAGWALAGVVGLAVVRYGADLGDERSRDQAAAAAAAAGASPLAPGGVVTPKDKKAAEAATTYGDTKASALLWRPSWPFSSSATTAATGTTLPPVDDEDLVRGANRFVLSRRDEYEGVGVGVNWKLRGIGYLYEKQQVVLAAQVVHHPGGSVQGATGRQGPGLGQPTPTPTPTPTRSIQIFNVYDPELYYDSPPSGDNNRTDSDAAATTKARRRTRRRMTSPAREDETEEKPWAPRDDCDRLTVWVRAYGPEVFAGTARAGPAALGRDCYWTFDVAATVPGSYGVDVKVLIWNGKGRDYEAEQVCNTDTVDRKQRKNLTSETLPQNVADVLFPLHAGFKGFKMYFPTVACCEICNRLSPYCEAWSAPPFKLVGPRKGNMGCELYFRPGTPPSEIPRSWILGDLNVTLAPKHTRRLDTLELNFGRPHGAEPQMFLGCGWSYWHTLDFPCLQGELDDKVFMLSDTFDVVGDAVEAEVVEPRQALADADSSPPPLPLCGRDAELLANTAGRWVQEPFPDDSECLVPFEAETKYSARYTVFRYSGERPHCWHRDAIDRIGLRCAEPNCALIDTRRYWSSRARVSRWMGVWREYACDYLEFTDRELQQCIDAKKVTSIQVQGASVAQNIESVLQQRTDPLTMYRNASDPDSIQVTVSTLALLHMTMDSNRMLRQRLRALKNATDRDVVYVYNGYYTSSEREPYTHTDRMLDMNKIVEEELVAKGYVPLNLYAMSAAWAFDADGQRDGMHLVGPPLRMGLTKVFHHLCADVVRGRRV